jgi:hypothetical protein
MKEAIIKKYTCDYCGFITIVHGDGIFTGNTVISAQEHENNCFYDPKHKKCATCKHRLTTHRCNTEICIKKTKEDENIGNGFFINVGVGDSCVGWELNDRPAPWYDRRNERESVQTSQNTKYFWFLIDENCRDFTSGRDLKIYFHVPDGLTMHQAKELKDEITNANENYGEENDGDFSEINYYDILEKSAEKLGIVFEYHKVDYNITL